MRGEVTAVGIGERGLAFGSGYSSSQRAQPGTGTLGIERASGGAWGVFNKLYINVAGVEFGFGLGTVRDPTEDWAIALTTRPLSGRSGVAGLTLTTGLLVTDAPSIDRLAGESVDFGGEFILYDTSRVEGRGYVGNNYDFGLSISYPFAGSVSGGRENTYLFRRWRFAPEWAKAFGPLVADFPIP